MPITRRRLRASLLAPLLAVLLALLAPGVGQAQSAPATGSTTPSSTEEKGKDAGLKPITKDTTPLPDSVTGGTKREDGPTGSSVTGAIAKLVVGLGVVLAVIYGVYWLLRSSGRAKRKGVAGPDGSMAVVGTTVLSPGRSLHLVRIGDDVVLVGSAEHAVTRLHVWSGEDAKRLDAALTAPIQGLADGGAGARLLDEIRRRTVRG